MLEIRYRRPFSNFPLLFVLLVWSLGPNWLAAASLSDPAADRYNQRVGTQTFDPLYHFTTNTLLVETANAITNMGSDILKLKLNKAFGSCYGVTLSSKTTNLVTLVRDEPSCRRAFDMPFRHYIAWTYAFSTSTPDWNNGYTSTSDQNNDYREFYDLTRYLLTNYNNSGKTFYLGHWEGDGYLNVNGWSTNPSPSSIQGFINYLNNRQKAIDDAKRTTAFTNVNVFGYAECNRVRDAMLNGPNNNQRMINYVIPYVTNLDYVSYSAYDLQRLSSSDMKTTLDYVEAHLPTNKVSVLPGERVWIGEYGYANAGDTPPQQEPETRAFIQRLLNYGRQSFPFILFWEMYDNETNTDGTYRYFYLIDPNNAKTPCYDLHQRFINRGRLLTAQFQERNGRLPSDSEYVALVSPLLNAPLPAPVNLTVNNQGATVAVSKQTVQVSGTLAQGVYGDECATVWVFYGLQDGGTTRSSWDQSQRIGLNTNFNSTTFSTVLSNVTANTKYCFRFYATNASGEAWSPTASQFSITVPQPLNPSAYASRLKIGFPGYNRGEALANFPLLVNLSGALPGFSYQQFASTSGGDLRFTDASGTNQIPYEIDEWNPNGTSSVWVRMPQLGSTNDYIWAYWGNPTAVNPPVWATDGSVWVADHYLVWHLKESGFPYLDSAQQSPALSGTAPSPITGLVGRGCGFDGATDYLNAGVVNLGSAFTLSAWVKMDPTASSIQTLWANKPGGWNSAGFAWYVNSYNTTDQQLRLETGDGSAGQTAATASGAVTFGVWHRVTAVVNEAAGTARLYVDGADRTQTSTVVTDFPSLATLNLGRFTNSSLYFKGSLDEVRIEAGTRSSNWVWASWMTVAGNSALQSYSAVNPQPTLAWAASTNGLQLSWPASAGVFGLYTTTNLTPPSVWQPVTNTAVLVDGQWQVLLGTNGPGNGFYRLQ